MTARRLGLLLITALAIVLAGCSSTSRRGGGYYQDDGPGSSPPPDIAAIPNAVPRIEPYAQATLRPYEVLGKRYVPLSGGPYKQEGIASWYGRKFHGNKTANGETYDMYAMTAAHPLLPIPSYARVTRPSNGRSIIVRINDRGPFHDGRIIDLSYVAAAKLGIIGPGSGQVIVQAITPDDIRKGSFDQPTLMASNNTPATAAPPTEVETRPIDEPASVQPVTPDALSAIDLAESGTAQPAEAADTTQVAAAPAGIYLQFGAFSNPENAEALVERIKVQLAASERGALHIDPSPNLYRVRMGPFSSRTQAVNAAAQIEAEIGARPTIALR